MRPHGWLAAGLIIVTTMACGRGTTSDESTNEWNLTQDRAAIGKTRQEYVSAWKAADAERIASVYIDDALVLYPNQPAISGRPAIVGYFKSFFAEFIQDSFELTSTEIEIVGPWAFDRGVYRWRGVPKTGGEPIEDHGKYLVILRRQPDGSWRVARDMDNSDRPLAQTTRGPG
jgi:uncharacterized protein (TIGR02246 family)